jgi:homoprotocatechuate degradation regulator HpaR
MPRSQGSKELPAAPAPSLPSTGRSLPIALLRARDAVMARFRPMLAEHGLTDQQWRVLRILGERGPLDSTELSELACILTPSMTRILRALEEQGMVTRSRHGTDRRRAVLALTVAGEAVLRVVTPHSSRIYAELEREFGSARLAKLLDLLEALARTRP